MDSYVVVVELVYEGTGLIRSRLATPVWLLAAACGANHDGEDMVPDPPGGSTQVLALGDLEVFETRGTEACRGTVARIERHADALSEIFGSVPPSARLFLYGTVAAVSADCDTPLDVVGGCAGPGYARAVPYAALHELVHLYARAQLGGVTWPALSEGLADRMDGVREIVRPDPAPSSIRDWIALGATDLPREVAMHFTAWVLDEFGIDQLLDAHRDVATVGEESVPAALAAALGFESVEALDEGYRTRSADVYPAYPDTVVSWSAEELAAGIELEASCGSVYSEGPTDGQLTTIVGLDIEVSGDAIVTYGDFPLL